MKSFGKFTCSSIWAPFTPLEVKWNVRIVQSFQNFLKQKIIMYLFININKWYGYRTSSKRYVFYLWSRSSLLQLLLLNFLNVNDNFFNKFCLDLFIGSSFHFYIFSKNHTTNRMAISREEWYCGNNTTRSCYHTSKLN